MAFYVRFELCGIAAGNSHNRRAFDDRHGGDGNGIPKSDVRATTVRSSSNETIKQKKLILKLRRNFRGYLFC